MLILVFGEALMGRKEVREFLQEKKLFSYDLDMDAQLERFREHMQVGLETFDTGNSMIMIPTYLSLGESDDLLEPVIVMDAGGTNFRICLTHFMQGKASDISQFKKSPMPGTDQEITADEFYNFIADQLEPYLEKSKKIAFCFSYACKMLPNHDGRILSFTKEVRIPSAIGTVVGEEIKNALAERSHNIDEISFVLLNDTVAALLGGSISENYRQYGGYAAMVLGTGLNTAYIEQNKNIAKLAGEIDPLGNMAINMESGNYEIDILSDIDRMIDEATTAPGFQLMEKMISGRYLGLQALYTIREAIQSTDLFSDFFKESFASISDMESACLNEFIDAPFGPGVLSQCCANEIDRQHVYFIIDAIFERAARLVAVMITALHIQMNVGKNPVKPLAITIEGSTYYRSRLFREKLNAHLKSYTAEKYEYYSAFLRVENANIIGSALAALLND